MEIGRASCEKKKMQARASSLIERPVHTGKKRKGEGEEGREYISSFNPPVCLSLAEKVEKND